MAAAIRIKAMEVGPFCCSVFRLSHDTNLVVTIVGHSVGLCKISTPKETYNLHALVTRTIT